MNPQLSISLSEADEVVLALNQHTATDPKVIGFTGYAINNNETGGSGNGTEGATTWRTGSLLPARRTVEPPRSEMLLGVVRLPRPMATC